MIDRKKFDNLVKEYQNYFTNHKGKMVKATGKKKNSNGAA